MSRYHSSLTTAQRTDLANRSPEPVSAIVFAQEHWCTESLSATFYSLASIEVGIVWDDR